MNRWTEWLEHRTGVMSFLHTALYEAIPGGARWRYVWGSTLVFAFVVQMITGTFLWMAYSPSNQTAWESVYYIQHEMSGGWLLRGIHHFMAQAMVVLLMLHLIQVVVAGAYKAPREFNFWIGLLLMLIVLGLSLTGYLLPWDQKGYWATNVATELMTSLPVFGPALQKLVVGGDSYGHHTLTRFFALHAGILPAKLILLVVVHMALFRRHGITTPVSQRPAQMFWPHQVLKDAIACVGVMAIVVFLTVRADWSGVLSGSPDTLRVGAELGAPADGSEQYAAARPEWYFLFLFQLLKFEQLPELFWVMVFPGILLGLLVAMPILGRWRAGHVFNVCVVISMGVGALLLTQQALRDDQMAQGADEEIKKIPHEPAKQTHRDRQLLASQEFVAASQQAHREAHRVVELIRERGGIPTAGALSLLRQDPQTQGPKIFRQQCASCHSWLDDQQQGIAAEGAKPSAPNLYGFGSRAWLRGLLDPQQIKSDQYFGNTAHRNGEMANFVTNSLSLDALNESERADLEKVIATVSAESQLDYQAELDARSRDAGDLKAGHAAIDGTFNCADCHKFRDLGELGRAPDLTGWGSAEWLRGMISNPEHERFYNGHNDRMPAFAPDDKAVELHPLQPDQLEILVQWLRSTPAP